MYFGKIFKDVLNEKTLNDSKEYFNLRNIGNEKYELFGKYSGKVYLIGRLKELNRYMNDKSHSFYKDMHGGEWEKYEKEWKKKGGNKNYFNLPLD
jgi:hypothetical protein